MLSFWRRVLVVNCKFHVFSCFHFPLPAPVCQSLLSPFAYTSFVWDHGGAGGVEEIGPRPLMMRSLCLLLATQRLVEMKWRLSNICLSWLVSRVLIIFFHSPERKEIM